MVNHGTEIQDIMDLVREAYPKYEYDEIQGFHKGPTEFEYNPGKRTNLSREEAVIGIKEPISRMARSILLKVRKHDDTWQVQDVLRVIEG